MKKFYKTENSDDAFRLFLSSRI